MHNNEWWEKFWKNRNVPKSPSRQDLLWQVGKTVHGKAIDEHQIDIIISEIKKHLSLEPDDTVLDAGCGNGFLTNLIKGECFSICGIDYAETLLKVARSEYGDDINFFHGSLGDPNALKALPSTIEKVYSYEVFQHLDSNEASLFLSTLLQHLPNLKRIYIASVPDSDLIKDFYNTDALWADYLKRKENGTEMIGHWWDKDQLSSLVNAVGLTCRFYEQHASLYTSHYRFDALLEPAAWI